MGSSHEKWGPVTQCDHCGLEQDLGIRLNDTMAKLRELAQDNLNIIDKNIKLEAEIERLKSVQKFAKSKFAKKIHRITEGLQKISTMGNEPNTASDCANVAIWTMEMEK
jgi:hypothetical protein